MISEPERISIRNLIDLYRNKMLIANPEYQRGVVWGGKQKKKLIDSVFRGYPLPLIYLHHIKKSVAGMQREDLEIIDGQQRITSLYEYVEGAFPLFDPVKDDDEAKFPRFLKYQPCPWGGKLFSSLSSEFQERLLDTELSIARIETDNPNAVRDLFVRLQSGLPLNAQEARDAWPGEFCEYILTLGGKPEIARYPGHPFFQGPMGLTPRSDRGKARQFAAQIAVLYFSRREHGKYADINASAINDFYFSHVDFDKAAKDAKRLNDILTALDRLLGSGKRPKLKAHDAIHLILLVDSLWDDYTRSWEAKLPVALDRFMENFANSKTDKDAENPDEFWLRYGQWTRVNSDRGETIARRHAFYMEKMCEYLGPLQLRDPNRLYGEVERAIIFYRQHKRCSQCDSEVFWQEAEIHHVKEHSKGGLTSLDNAALVHPSCHPKGEAAVKAFAEKFFSSLARRHEQSPSSNKQAEGYNWRNKDRTIFLPNDTELRASYGSQDYLARVKDGQIIYEGKSLSPSALMRAITRTSRNAWRDLWIKLPASDTWILADNLRRQEMSLEDS